MTEEQFKQFWLEYPRKVSKLAAQKKFMKIPKENFKLIMSSLEKYKKTEQWKETKYIPHPATWLYQERWEDEIIIENKTHVYVL